MQRGAGLDDPDRSLLLVIEALRRDAETTPPELSLELAEILREGFGAAAPVLAAPEPTRTSSRRSLLRVASAKLAGVGLVAQLGLGVAAGATGVTVAAATDSLPTAVQDQVVAVLETIAPFVDLPDSGDRGRSSDAPGRNGLTPGQQGDTPADGANPPGAGEAPGNRANAPAHGRDDDVEAPGDSGDAPGKPTDVPGGSGDSGDAPGKPTDVPGDSGDAPGKPTDAPGNSGDAPGKPVEGEQRGGGPGATRGGR